LAITFLLGFAIGFTTAWVLREASLRNADAPPSERASADASVPGLPAKPSAGPLAPTPAPVASETGETETNVLTQDQIAAATKGFAATGETWPGRHVFLTISGTSLDNATHALLKEVKPGGVLLRSENIASREQAADLIREIKRAVGLGATMSDLPLIAVEQEGGRMNPLLVPNAPSAAELGATRNVEEAYRVGRSYAAACVATGAIVLLAPVLDMAQPDGNPELTGRCLSDDSRIVTAMGIAFAQGAMAEGVLPVAKHYPGIGSVKPASNKEPAALKHAISGIAQAMYPFSEAVNNGLPGVLAAPVAVPAMDKERPNRPASQSSKLIRDIIRDLWRFQGVIIADNATPQTAAEALAAGCDAVLCLNPSAATIREVCQAIEDSARANAALRINLADSAARLDAWPTWLNHPTAPEKAPLPLLQQMVDSAATAAPATVSPAPEPSEETQAAPGASAETAAYIVQKGDSISRIAAKHGVSARHLMAWNRLDDGAIRPGQTLIVQRPAAPGATAAGSAAIEEPASPEPTETSAPAPVESVAEPPPPLPTESPTTPEEKSAPEPDAPAPAAESPSASATPEPTASSEATVSEPAPAAPPAPKEPAPNKAKAEAPQPPNTTVVRHKVEEGETLWRIARKYGATPDALRTWNNMNSDIVKVGQTLKIYATKNDAAPESAKSNEEDSVPPNSERVEHVIERGETIDAIAHRYGVRRKDIAMWNRLENDSIKFGRKLVIYLPNSSEPDAVAESLEE